MVASLTRLSKGRRRRVPLRKNCIIAFARSSLLAGKRSSDAVHAHKYGIYRDSEKRNIAECIVAKNRHGETGKVELRGLPEYTSFGTLENRYQEEN